MLDDLEAIFFDFDGVLVDSVNIKSEAFVDLYPEASPAQKQAILSHHLDNGGMSRYRKIEHYNREIFHFPSDDVSVEGYAKRFSELVVEKVVTSNEIAGAARFLKSVAGDLPLFIISGTPEGELRTIIEKRYGKGFFKEILGSPTLKSEHLASLLSHYQFKAENCLFFGDALGDKDAADSCFVPFVAMNPAVNLASAVNSSYKDWFEFMKAL